jgi:hypothetical protein
VRAPFKAFDRDNFVLAVEHEDRTGAPLPAAPRWIAPIVVTFAEDELVQPRGTGDRLVGPSDVDDPFPGDRLTLSVARVPAVVRKRDRIGSGPGGHPVRLDRRALIE